MKSSVTIALVPSVRSGPWIYWDDLRGSLEKAADLGFDAVELFTGSGGAVDVAELAKLLDKLGLAVSAVGTGAGKVVHGLTLTDPDPAIRSKAVDFISEMISFGAALKAPAIIGSMQGNVQPGTSREHALAWLTEGLNILGEKAAALGVRLIYEPLNRYETNLINHLGTGVELIKTLATGNVFLLADLFHMNIEEASVMESLRSARPYIGHVHLADSNRRPAGLGHTPIKEIADVLKETGYDGYISAEAFPYPAPDAAAEQTIRAFKTYFKTIP